jgi:hypothetical protein
MMLFAGRALPTIPCLAIAAAIETSRSGGTMEQEWRFEQDENGQWRWLHLDGLNETVSTQTFPDEVHCVLDAMRFVVRRRRP